MDRGAYHKEWDSAEPLTLLLFFILKHDLVLPLTKNETIVVVFFFSVLLKQIQMNFKLKYLAKLIQLCKV